MNKSINFLKYTILLGLFAVPFIVLVVFDSMYFPFIVGKSFIFRILVEILFGLWAVLAMYSKEYRPKKSLVLTFLSSFTGVLVLSTIFGANPSRSFWSNYERMEGLVTFLHLFAYFIVLTTTLNTEKLWKYFFNTSIAASFYTAVYGLRQFFGTLAIHQSSNRLDATLGNASYLAIYMVFHIFLSLWFFFKEKQWWRWLYLPIAVVETVVLYNTATRGAIIGFIGGLILAGILLVVSSESKKVKIAAGSSLGLILLLLGLFFTFKTSAFVKNSPVLRRFSSISLTNGTTASRLTIWKMSYEGFKEKPLLGWGPENYNLVFNKYYEPILYRQEPWFDRAHNVFFDRLATNGILGLLTYLGLFGSVIYYLLFRREDFGFSSSDSSFLVATLAAYFVHNVFVFDNLISFILFFTVIGYVHFRAIEKREVVTKEFGEGIKASLSAVVLVITILAVYSINVPGILAGRTLIEALQQANKGDFNSALKNFNKTLAYNSFGTTEAREQLIQLSSSAFVSQGLDKDSKVAIYQKATSEMVKQIEENPGDIRYMSFLGSIYNIGGDYDKAMDVFRQAIELSPAKQDLYFGLGTSLVNKGDYKKTEEVLRTAFELDPSYEKSRNLYAMSLVYNGKLELSDKIL
ncbi:MAG: hypothetical protein COU27_02170, partial [Candidatus Levybacteria bacterium CG10_big_fil_rev_8_21_14_0_10_36_7]